MNRPRSGTEQVKAPVPLGSGIAPVNRACSAARVTGRDPASFGIFVPGLFWHLSPSEPAPFVSSEPQQRGKQKPSQGGSSWRCRASLAHPGVLMFWWDVLGLGWQQLWLLKGEMPLSCAGQQDFPAWFWLRVNPTAPAPRSLSLFCSGPYLLSQLIGALGSELYTLSFTLSSLCSARSFSKQDIPDLLCPELSREQSSSCASLGLK